MENLALAIDVSPDRSVASVALAGCRDDGTWHIELEEQKTGVNWIAAHVEQLLRANPDIRALVIDAASPASSIVDDLARRGVKPTMTQARDMARACAQIYDGIVEGTLHHTDQPQVNYALANARRRALGDAWAWNRKSATSDITPIVACTLALWGAQTPKDNITRPQPRSGRAVFRN